jgi:hypothetical protein
MVKPELLEPQLDQDHTARTAEPEREGKDLEKTLISVWRQALVEGVDKVDVGGRLFPVWRTSKKHLLQVDFNVDSEVLRGLQQNPAISSRWAELAREGHRIMQFLCRGRYIGNVVDGKVTFYGRRAEEMGLVR